MAKKNIEFTPYVITAHPGSTAKHAENLVQDMQKLGLQIRKFQDFTPTPGTLSTAMYVTGLNPDQSNRSPFRETNRTDCSSDVLWRNLFIERNRY